VGPEVAVGKRGGPAEVDGGTKPGGGTGGVCAEPIDGKAAKRVPSKVKLKFSRLCCVSGWRRSERRIEVDTILLPFDSVQEPEDSEWRSLNMSWPAKVDGIAIRAIIVSHIGFRGDSFVCLVCVILFVSGQAGVGGFDVMGSSVNPILNPNL
jgi:hypothetical protein